MVKTFQYTKLFAYIGVDFCKVWLGGNVKISFLGVSILFCILGGNSNSKNCLAIAFTSDFSVVSVSLQEIMRR